jgi:hypothetical protein
MYQEEGSDGCDNHHNNHNACNNNRPHGQA